MICPFCTSGHIFLEAKLKLYAKVSTATTRLYLGRCQVCQGTGKLAALPFDYKQLAAGEAVQNG